MNCMMEKIIWYLQSGCLRIVELIKKTEILLAEFLSFLLIVNWKFRFTEKEVAKSAKRKIIKVR